MKTRPLYLFAAAFGLLLAAAGCSAGDSSSGDDSNPANTAASGTAGYLTSVCPSTIKIQLGWYPQPDPYAMVFGLLAPGGKLDTGKAGYAGTALADPNQKIEIIGGGPLVSYQQVSSLMYADPDILLGDVSLDEAIAQSKKFPTVGVIAPFEKSPLGLMYNPDAVSFTSLQDVKDSKTTVLAASGQTSIAALVGLGKLDKSQIDSSYKYSPAQFVAANGKIAQQAFATEEPYAYENSSFWKKPTKVLLLADQGYPNYQNDFVVTPANLQSKAACLQRLVPLMQQSMIGYFKRPDATNALIADLSTKLKNPTPVTIGSEQFARDVMSSQGLVANAAGSPTFGLFDASRVQNMVEVVSPVFTGTANFDPEVKPGALFTNKFLDPSIGFAK
ncbi:hypothetical protein [Dactylosporangium sp. CA-092794]|uniref:hypothetical protein n=1 Tax=Dactylosporangium sp. CA-092794 TaxID=3239929 RepID=UPI003D8A5FFB